MGISAQDTKSLPSSPRCVLNIEYFEFLLNNHPNRLHVNYILDGLRAGFDIGFLGSSVTTHPKNLRSAYQFQPLLAAAIAKEIDRGHTVGPFDHPRFKSPIAPLLEQLKKTMDHVAW